MAIEDPRAARRLFWGIGDYAFDRLGCERLTLAAVSTNLPAIELHNRIGAVHEGLLVGAGRHGEDIILSRLSRHCELWRRLNGQRRRRQHTSDAGLRAADSPSGTSEPQSV
jgi:hypothetical protein